MLGLETGETGEADGQGSDGWEGATKNEFEMMDCVVQREWGTDGCQERLMELENKEAVTKRGVPRGKIVGLLEQRDWKRWKIISCGQMENYGVPVSQVYHSSLSTNLY